MNAVNWYEIYQLLNYLLVIFEGFFELKNIVLSGMHTVQRRNMFLLALKVI